MKHLKKKIKRIKKKNPFRKKSKKGKLLICFTTIIGMIGWIASIITFRKRIQKKAKKVVRKAKPKYKKLKKLMNKEVKLLKKVKKPTRKKAVKKPVKKKAVKKKRVVKKKRK